MYQDHADQRDKFEIFAIHEPSMKSFADLDEKLTKVKERFWQGDDLPFPVLLDSTGETNKLYGIRAFPTGLLIDPEGKLVGEATPADLEAKLRPLPAAKKWARQRDIEKNVFWSFEPSQDTLAKFAHIMKDWTNCDVELDADAVKSAGLTPDGPLPGVVVGVNITWRSIDELLLAPHGLGIAPSKDGKKLLITTRPAANGEESYFQKLHAKELNEQLDAKPKDTAGKEAKPLEIKDQPLLDAIKLVGNEFDLPVALDAKAMQAKTLDPSAKVSGVVGPDDLRRSLTKLVAPLGLTVEVRDEVVLVTPGRK